MNIRPILNYSVSFGNRHKTNKQQNPSVTTPKKPTAKLHSQTLYDLKETKEILKRVSSPSAHGAGTDEAEHYSIYLSEKNSVVINNLYRTNDTIIIRSDGSAASVGSWHYKEIAQKGTYSDIVEDAKKRYAKKWDKKGI